MYRYFLLLFLITAPAFAVEPLASSDLLQRCSSEDNVSRLACRSWMHGFMGGAFAMRTARPVIPNEKETFSDRAKRTRAAPGRDIYGQNVDARYCVPIGTTIDELADKLIAYAASDKPVPDQANQLMLSFLRKSYPCGKPAN